MNEVHILLLLVFFRKAEIFPVISKELKKKYYILSWLLNTWWYEGEVYIFALNTFSIRGIVPVQK